MTNPKQPDSEFDVISQNLAQVERMVAHELGLIGVRMSWFTISQSFLFAAYATIVSSRLFIFADAAPISLQSSFSQSLVAILASLLSLCIPAVGWLFATVAHKSVQAAANVLESLDPCRGKYLIQLNELLSGTKKPSQLRSRYSRRCQSSAHASLLSAR